MCDFGYEIWDEEGEKKQGAGWKMWNME